MSEDTRGSSTELPGRPVCTSCFFLKTFFFSFWHFVFCLQQYLCICVFVFLSYFCIEHGVVSDPFGSRGVRHDMFVPWHMALSIRVYEYHISTCWGRGCGGPTFSRSLRKSFPLAGARHDTAVVVGLANCFFFFSANSSLFLALSLSPSRSLSAPTQRNTADDGMRGVDPVGSDAVSSFFLCILGVVRSPFVVVVNVREHEKTKKQLWRPQGSCDSSILTCWVSGVCRRNTATCTISNLTSVYLLETTTKFGELKHTSTAWSRRMDAKGTWRVEKVERHITLNLTYCIPWVA